MLTGLVSIGTLLTFTCSGLNLPVLVGSAGFFTLEASTTTAPSQTYTIWVTGSISMTLS